MSAMLAFALCVFVCVAEAALRQRTAHDALDSRMAPNGLNSSRGVVLAEWVNETVSWLHAFPPVPYVSLKAYPDLGRRIRFVVDPGNPNNTRLTAGTAFSLGLHLLKQADIFFRVRFPAPQRGDLETSFATRVVSFREKRYNVLGQDVLRHIYVQMQYPDVLFVSLSAPLNYSSIVGRTVQGTYYNFSNVYLPLVPVYLTKDVQFARLEDPTEYVNLFADAESRNERMPLWCKLDFGSASSSFKHEPCRVRGILRSPKVDHRYNVTVHMGDFNITTPVGCDKSVSTNSHCRLGMDILRYFSVRLLGPLHPTSRSVAWRHPLMDAHDAGLVDTGYVGLYAVHPAASTSDP